MEGWVFTRRYFLPQSNTEFHRVTQSLKVNAAAQLKKPEVFKLCVTL